MKKRLLILPIMGGLLLTGCKITLFGKTFYLFEKKPDDAKPDPVVKPSIPLMKEYGDYKLADSIEDGVMYKLLVKRSYGEQNGKVRYFNGDYHRDGDFEYSFYLGQGFAEEDKDLSEAADIEAISIGDGKFNFKVHAEGRPWDGKFMGIYPSKPFSTPLLSFALLDSPESTEFEVHSAKDGIAIEEVQSSSLITSEFQYFEKYDDRTVKAPGIFYKHVADGDEEKEAKFFGTAGDYVSFDCKSYETSLDPSSYDLAHFYVHK